MFKTMQKYGIILSIFAIILTGITALMNKLTNHTIKKQEIERQKILFDLVIPAGFYDNNLQKSCFIVDTPQLGKGIHRIFIAYKKGDPVGAVMEVTAPDGYSGVIQLLVATDFNGVILGTYVIEHHETPGLGDKIDLRVSNWILSFIGKNIRDDNDEIFSIKKDGGSIDQFTGATITPRAVVNAVKKAGLYAKTLPEQLDTMLACEEGNYESD